MQVEEIQKFIDEEISTISIVYLFNYKQFGLPSRILMLEEHDSMLKDLLKGEGKFANLPVDTKIFYESKIYIETLERLFMLLEDFCAISEGLCDDIKKLQEKVIIHANTEKFLRNFDDSKWKKLLRYAPMETLSLTPSEKDFLEKVRNKNIEVLNSVLDLLKVSFDLYWLAYQKYKHGNSLIYGFRVENVEGERLLIIPVIYNHKDPSNSKAIIANEKYYYMWRHTLNTLYKIVEDIVQRAIDYAETGGHLIAEHRVYFQMSEEDFQMLNNIANKCNNNVERINIKADVHVNISLNDIKKDLELLKHFKVEFQ